MLDVEFYSLTPRQFKALLDRHERQLEHDEFMFAQLTSCLVNFSYRSPEKLTSPLDFMPSAASRPKRKDRKTRITKKIRDEVTASWRSGLAAMAKRQQR